MIANDDRISVLVLDNDVLAGQYIANWLGRFADFRTAFTSHPSQALLQCSLPERQPDVLIVDIMLDGVSGTSICARIRKETSQIGLLCITAYDPNQYRAEVAECGAQGVIAKNQILTLLPDAVRKAAAGQPIEPDTYADSATSHAILESSDSSSIQPLNASEKEILRLYARNMTTAQVLVRLGMNRNTLNTHLHRALGKLHAPSRAAALITCNHYSLLG
ncbi:response regulator transcription factor [Bifidobacterium callitrichos]|nr:response regulator transcription factor [Bifidobacterium callitrichos]